MHYSTEVESYQVQVNDSSTAEQLYEKGKVKIFRLYLCTKIRNVERSSEEEETDMQKTSTAVVALTGTELYFSTEVEIMDDMVEQEIGLEIVIEDVQLDDTVLWNEPPQRPGEQKLSLWTDQPPQGMDGPQPEPVAEPWNDGHRVNLNLLL